MSKKIKFLKTELEKRVDAKLMKNNCFIISNEFIGDYGVIKNLNELTNSQKQRLIHKIDLAQANHNNIIIVDKDIEMIRENVWRKKCGTLITYDDKEGLKFWGKRESEEIQELIGKINYIYNRCLFNIEKDKKIEKEIENLNTDYLKQKQLGIFNLNYLGVWNGCCHFKI